MASRAWVSIRVLRESPWDYGSVLARAQRDAWAGQDRNARRELLSEMPAEPLARNLMP
jgi:hypothetical protein